MDIQRKFLFRLLLFSAFFLLLILILQPLEILEFKKHIDVLFPKGMIGIEQRNLLFIIQAIMLFVIIPVYIFTFVFSWKYRAGNPKGKYDPHLIDSPVAEYFWWGIPTVFTLVICVLTWIRTYELDPYRPIEHDKKPLTIQVVALQWKWLFLYPEENIASVNLLQIPEQTPIRFLITADAPMNSFWIPALGGQIYAMPNMQTELNLIADEPGEFRGLSANISGLGFAGMHFLTRATKEEEYQKWIESVKKSEKILSVEEYNQLALPSENNPVEIFQLIDNTLFEKIIAKYRPPKNSK